MSYEEEKELLELTRCNNRMLNDIINYINLRERYAQHENDADFSRNILANLISNKLEFKS